MCATLIRRVFYLFNEVNVVYIANGLFMNMSEVFIWKAYSKDDKKLSLRADDLHSVGIKKIAWFIEGIYVNAKWWKICMF